MKKSIRTEIIINANKETVWQLLTNFSQYKHWNPFITSIEGELKVGSRLKNTLNNAGKSIVFRPKVLQVFPDHYFDWKGILFIPGIFDGHHYFQIEEISTTQVKLIHGENFSGILVDLIMKKIGDNTRRNFIRMNEELKNLAESK